MNSKEYETYLLKNEVYEFIKIILFYIQNPSHNQIKMLDLETERHLSIMNDITSASFERGDDEKPF